MTEQQLREEMVQIGASLFSRGYATGSAGNLSLLLPDGTIPPATWLGSSPNLMRTIAMRCCLRMVACWAIVWMI